MIRLDRKRAEEYELYAEIDDILDRLTNVHVAADALGFVRSFGLLTTTPDAHDLAEPFAEWSAHAHLLRELFYVYDGLRQVVLDGPRFRELRAQVTRVSGAWGLTHNRNPDDPEELRLLAADLLAAVVNQALGNVRHAITSETWLEPPGPAGTFRFSPVVSNPLEAAYHQLALVIVNRREMRACEECGALFPVRDRRQRFHDSRCASRSRQRRHAERQRKEKDDGQPAVSS